MGTTIPGGAYLAADGKSWHDAEGRPLDRGQVSEAARVQAAQAEEHDQAETFRTNLEARRDPVARALLTQQQARAEGAPVRGRAAKPEGAE